MSKRHKQIDELMTRTLAMQQAQIDEAWWAICEEAGWIRPKLDYTARDVHRLARTRRLRDQLHLDKNAIDIVLHMRRRIVSLQHEMAHMERQMAERERSLREEIRRLQSFVASDGYFE